MNELKEMIVKTDCGEITVQEYDDGIANGVKIFLGDNMVAMVDCYRMSKYTTLPTTARIPISEIKEKDNDEWTAIALGRILASEYGTDVEDLIFHKEGDLYIISDIKWDTSARGIPEARLLIYGPDGPDFDEPQDVVHLN